MSNKRRSKPPLLPEFKTTDPFVPKLVKKPTPTDAALIAGRILLMRALESAGTTPSAAGADGLVVHVGVSDQTWADVLRDSWRDSIRNGGRCYESAFDRYSDGEDTWVAWLPEVAPKPFVLREGNESFTRSLAKGIHCVGFAADATWLPQDLVQTADLHIVIPTLLGRDVAAIAEELCGHEATVLISNGEACILRPRHLRLARRPVQTADEYVLKLRGLIESEKVRTQTAKTASPRDQPDLSRLHGMDEVVAWGHAVQRDLQGIAAGSLTWSDVDRGCLISGPPGVGKTLFARGLAATLGIPLVVGSYSQWHGTGNSHQGDLLKAMRQTFSEARSKAPCILSLDEIDSFPNRATISHKFSEWEIQVVNGLLAEIDGIEGRDGVILVAACNFPKKLDPALTRSGRLDRHFHVGLPDRAALARILREHLGKDLAAEDLRGAALAAVGASGADCESIVRTARRRARDGKREIMLADLLHAIDGDDTRTPEDQWISAVHEAGHVVATCVLRPGGLGMVSLRENDGSGGRTYSRAAKSAFVRSSDLKERLAMLLAGRAAEHEVFGIPSSGAGGMSTSDLARATNLVAVSIASFGLDEVGGMAWRGNPDIDGTPDFLAANPLLAERVDEVLADAYVAARDLVCPRIVAVRAVASALLERRVLDGAEAEAIVFQAHGYAP